MNPPEFRYEDNGLYPFEAYVPALTSPDSQLMAGITGITARAIQLERGTVVLRALDLRTTSPARFQEVWQSAPPTINEIELNDEEIEFTANIGPKDMPNTTREAARLKIKHDKLPLVIARHEVSIAACGIAAAAGDSHLVRRITANDRKPRSGVAVPVPEVLHALRAPNQPLAKEFQKRRIAYETDGDAHSFIFMQNALLAALAYHAALHPANGVE